MSDKNETLPGGWSPFTSNISKDAQQAFAEATKNWVGVKYSDFAVSQQVVAGMNYNFLCNGTASTQNPLTSLYSVHIFKPLSGDARIVKIINIPC